jgi:hypothetical protein
MFTGAKNDKGSASHSALAFPGGAPAENEKTVGARTEKDDDGYIHIRL